ncbi:MAG: DUF5320 domain-containing protein [Massilibacteroides sp.]|nr:DUF5320 domain-containing protein [Massilibacteroides sp.]MDD3063522.1 DUF5320 domain-containing protein [Massilibacteroides sp.]MDD4115336.1 DUF5320 domain-containing protein [Massilibacteroides sp.]MDD4660766.1 DUF5320 domain-containing protein [Massilibacteroides sp.]
MPGFNQTGPMGQGAMTGKRMGKCNRRNVDKPITVNEPATENSTANNERRGMGKGRGRGQGGRGMGFNCKNRNRNEN